MASKTAPKNPPVLNWRCQLTQVDLYNGRKTVLVCVVVISPIRLFAAQHRPNSKSYLKWLSDFIVSKYYQCITLKLQRDVAG